MKLPDVESFSVCCVLVPINPPHRTASGIVAKSPLVLIDLHCTGGLVGHAILFTYTPLAQKPVADLVLGFAELVQGQPLQPRAIYDLLQNKTRLIGPQGLVGMALAGIDMALWDALARFQQLPLVQLLGGSARPVIAYGGTGYDGELETARQAENWVKKGFSGVKAKIGYPSVAEDVAVIRAMRKAVGPEVDLMVDYNQSLPAQDAIARLQQLDHEGLLWIEEPILATDYINSARICNAIQTPIQSGENLWGPSEMRLALSLKATDFIMPDVMKIGGVTGWLKAAEYAQVQGTQVSSHLWPELSAHLLAAGSAAHRLEYVDWWNEILDEPLHIVNGQSRLDTDLPGSGISWNSAKVDLYRV